MVTFMWQCRKPKTKRQSSYKGLLYSSKVMGALSLTHELSSDRNSLRLDVGVAGNATIQEILNFMQTWSDLVQGLPNRVKRKKCM